MRNADLPEATLRQSILRDADLRDADLLNASLRYADLTGADLRGTNLREVDLSYVNWAGTQIDARTVIPARIRQLWSIVNLKVGSTGNCASVNLGWANLAGVDLSADLTERTCAAPTSPAPISPARSCRTPSWIGQRCRERSCWTPILDGASLADADISGAIGLSPAPAQE
ncbi:MAG: pentapeptide repeat-containing protein [Caldilineaceae bacterium]